MMISASKLIGSLVYRTREALNNDQRFLNRVKERYSFAPICFINDRFNFWHFPGTDEEISKILLSLEKTPKGGLLRFPSLFNFKNKTQDVLSDRIIYRFDLAFVAPVHSTWLTEQRENEVFENILRPLYLEFMNQVRECRYFNLDYGKYIPHIRQEVFTTGGKGSELVNRYSEHVDALEIYNLTLEVKDICDREILRRIDQENDLVTKNI